MTGRIGVLGAGAMGSAVAGFLTRAGRDVVLVGRGGPHVAAVADHGLLVVPPDGAPWRVPVAAVSAVDDLPTGSLDVLVLLTKTYDTATAAAGVAPALAPGGVAVSLQNGLGNDGLLADAFGSRRSLVGVTTVGAGLVGPGTVTVSAATADGHSTTELGAFGRAGGDRRADEVADVLTAAGLPARHSRTVETAIWEKLALAVMSPISAVLGVTVRTVWASPEGRSLVAAMFDEVVAVGQAKDVLLDRDRAWEHACAVFDGTGEHSTSMCADVQQGRRTELATMAGAVHRLAEELGVPVPVHTTVVHLLAVRGVR